ncbi:hypothetical protein AX14_011707 [Amanita brunnescens Koide BX004]|nr:hypothetical protein AX14_011707 [Amanita brunnescens Koide BX004]
MALRENPLVLVKWSMRGNLVLKCAKPMDDLIKDGIKDALEYFFPSPSAEIMVLNKPPTTALKFLAVPRHNLDGSDTDEMDLLNDLTAHPMWADVELWANPKFINLRQGMAGATVVVSVIDDNQGPVNDGSSSHRNLSAVNASLGAIREHDVPLMFSFAHDVVAPMTSVNMTITVTPARKARGTPALHFVATAADLTCRRPKSALSIWAEQARSGTQSFMLK